MRPRRLVAIGAAVLMVVVLFVLKGPSLEGTALGSRGTRDDNEPSISDINALKEREDELRRLVQHLTVELDKEKTSNQHLNEELEMSKDAGRPKPSSHHLAVLVPFRNAHQELAQFVPHMATFLRDQGVSYTIVIINQADSFRFNRGALLNIGFLLTEHGHDYIAMHDVDLLPLSPLLNYSFPPQPRHLAAPWLHPIYHYKNFIGGIMLISGQHYRMLNGLSNNFWGWGREDDEFYKRLVEAGLHLERPGNLSTGTQHTFRHLHDQEKRVRDMMKVGQQYTAGMGRDTGAGINTTAYTVLAVHREEINGFAYVRIDAQLECDTERTPWCVPPSACVTGYFRHKPSGVCRRCTRNCWVGFVLVGACSEAENPQCLKVGRDISEVDAAAHPKGNIPIPK